MLFDCFVLCMVGFYWLLLGEFDVCDVVFVWCVVGVGCCVVLLVIGECYMLFVFYVWDVYMLMCEGYYWIFELVLGIVVVFDFLLIFCVGFDLQCYWFGYGGGYYDCMFVVWLGDMLFVMVGIVYEVCCVDVLLVEVYDFVLCWIVIDVVFYLVVG